MNISPIPFFIFGAGQRRKVIYRRGAFLTWPDGKAFFRCEPAREVVDPAKYRVHVEAKDGRQIDVYEDEAGLWIEEDGLSRCLSEGRVHLPTFEGHPYQQQLRILHHEILVNIVKGRPLPNFLVYRKPWYRDAAMVAMVLQHTHNLELIRDWIMSLGDCFDLNNAGNREPDNLGQVLYLLSLASTKHHTLVPAVLEAMRDFMTEGHVCGLTDFSEHPVYQTAWLKFGLKALGLPDYLKIPEVKDSYAGLCWWYGEGLPKSDTRTHGEVAKMYPYLAWAEAHTRKERPPLDLAGLTYPLSWEANASQADYAGMKLIDPSFVQNRLCAPHSWHAAEMFLYLLECV